MILGLISCKNQEYKLYVGNDLNTSENVNFNTIKSALGEALNIKKKNKHSKISIYLKNGEYRLNEPIEINSDLNNLSLIGADSDSVIVKGSQQLNLDWNIKTDSIWVAHVKGNFNFDQLFVDGKQQILARYPNYNEEGGHWQGHAPDAISPERILSWKHPVGAIVHAMHSGEWGGFHYQISKINDKGELQFNGGHQNNRPSEMHPTYRMVENVLEELDSPGEWFFDKETNQLYYWPSESVKVNSAIFEGATLKNLITIKGQEHQPVKNVVIQGITFKHAKRTVMEEYEPLLRSDWTIFRGGAVFIEGAENVKIAECEFTNLGGNVIFVSNYNRNINIQGNHIHDCGASAISFVGSPEAVRSPSFQYDDYVNLSEMDTVKGPANNNYPSKSVVSNNLIYRIGRTEKQTAGVEISMAMDLTISHNSIYDIPRAGINVSEGTWGGHVIEFNDVFNTVLETSDHGAFNSWGRDRFWHPDRAIMNTLTTNNPEMPNWDAIHTTIIRNNRFRCDHGWDIDLDDGSSNYSIYNNLCLNGGIKLREGFYRVVKNNIMVNNGFHPHVWFKNSGDVFKNNIVFTSHQDIRLLGWGKEVDYNFFPDEASLKVAQSKGVDTHSIFGNIAFKNSSIGNYDLVDTTNVVKVGFKPFKTTNVFGVFSQKLKKMSKNPAFPEIYFSNSLNENKKVNWLGGKIKNIETIEERSASGLNKTAGVLIVSIDTHGILEKSEIQEGDVIVMGEGQDINTISDLMKIYQENNWKGILHLTVFRNQKPMEYEVRTK